MSQAKICCQATLTLVSPADNHNNLVSAIIKTKERSDWIKASNVISYGDATVSNGVVYHAENFVELNPGFEALLGSQFAAYPEGCSGTFMYKNQAPSQSHDTTAVEDEKINLIKIDKGFTIIPNPSNATIEITMKDSNFSSVNITTIDGKTVVEQNINPTSKAQLDVSSYAKGVYIINVTAEDGKLYTAKLIKN